MKSLTYCQECANYYFHKGPCQVEGHTLHEVDKDFWMGNVLLLDDDTRRRDYFRDHISDSATVTYVETAEDAIVRLQNWPFDVISLDHDLGGEHFVNSDRKDCGMEVARFIRDNPNAVRVGYTFCHSYNTPARQQMVSLLRNEAFMWAIDMPFGNSLIRMINGLL